MRVHFEKIDEISNGVTQFYTIRIGNSELTEFELFDEKEFPNHQEEIEITYNVISQMQDREARRIFFKEESGANALPRVSEEIMNNNKADFGLRLYCIFLTPELVILSNGDIKTRINPLECPNVAVHFKRIKKIASILDKAVISGEINYNNENPFEDFEIEI